MSTASSERHQTVRASPLSLVGPVAVAIIPVLTALFVWLGPDSSIPTGPSRLAPDMLKLSLSEPTDRMILVAWLVAASAMALVLSTGAVGWMRSREWISNERWVWATLPGLLLIGFGLLYRDDVTTITPPIGLVEVVTGAALAGAIVWVSTRRIQLRRLANALMIVAALALYAPVWLQFTDRLASVYDVRFTFSELAAVGAGSTPLHDFFPQYTQLLGFPIAPLLRLFPSQAVGICLGWVLLLQAITLVVAVGVAAWAGGRRFLGPAAIIVPSLAFLAGPGQSSSFTYFADNPLRTVLPVVAIAATCFALRNPSRAGGAYIRLLVFAGCVSGIAALNNPDFGIPVFIIVWITAVVAAAGRRRQLLAAVAIPGAAVTVFALYAGATAVAGVPPRWGDWLLFPSLFGQDGFQNVPMPSIGWHVAGVTLFVSAAVAGMVLVRSASLDRPSARRRRGLVLMLVAGWSLLSLPYYAGRSLVPTFVGGYALQVGWTVACLLPLIVAGVRRRPWQRAASSAAARMSVVLGLLALVASMAALTKTATNDAYSRSTSEPVTDPTLPALHRALANTSGDLATALRRGQVAQAVRTSTLIGLDTGIRSVAVFSSPDYLALSPALSYRQCVRLIDDPATFVIIESVSRSFLEGVPECAVALRLDAPLPLPDPLGVVKEGFQAIPVR